MGIRFNQRTGKWDVSYCKRHPTTRQPKSLKRVNLDSQAEAKRVFAELVHQVNKSLEESSTGTMLYRELLRKFYQSLEDRDLAKATIENYQLCLDAHTLNLWGRRPIDSIRTEEIRNLIKVTLADRSRTHQKSMLKFIRGVFNYAVEAGLLHKTPVPFMQFRLGNKLKAVLNENQVRIFLEKAKQYDHEWYPIWATAVYTGMRNEELYALTWDNVDLDSRLIFVRRVWTKKDGFKDLTKSGEDRVAEIAPALLALLKELKLKNPDSSFVLPRIDAWDGGRQAEILRFFMLGLNLPQISFHNLRATWATIMLAKGVEPIKVMKMGGWRDLKTLNNHYVRLAGVDIKGATDRLDFHDPTPQEATLLTMPKHRTSSEGESR